MAISAAQAARNRRQKAAAANGGYNAASANAAREARVKELEAAAKRRASARRRASEAQSRPSPSSSPSRSNPAPNQAAIQAAIDRRKKAAADAAAYDAESANAARAARIEELEADAKRRADARDYANEAQISAAAGDNEAARDNADKYHAAKAASSGAGGASTDPAKDPINSHDPKNQRPSSVNAVSNLEGLQNEQANQASMLYNWLKNDTQVYGGKRTADLDSGTQSGIDAVSGQRQGYRNIANQGASIGAGLNAGGLTSQGKEAEGVYKDLTPNQIDGYRKSAMDTMSNMQDGNNGAFRKMLDAETREREAAVNRQMASNGRSGSGVHQNMLTRDIGDMRNKAMAQNYFQNQNLRANAANSLFGMQGDLNSERMSAAGKLSDLGNQGLKNKVNSFNAARIGQNDLSNQYQREIKTGDIRRAAEQDRLTADHQRWNEESEAPWMNLMRYKAATPGAANSPVQRSKVNQGSNNLGKALAGIGSGAAIGSAFGPVGTGIGAAAGGLMGYFS